MMIMIKIMYSIIYIYIYIIFHVSTVLKLLKMAKGIRALLDTVMQALPQVGNLGLLFFLLFFIFAALGVELFGRLGKKTCFMMQETFMLYTIYCEISMNLRRIAVVIFVFSTFPECDEEYPCQGLGEHAHFKNFGMGFLTLFRVATGDNWNGIMKVHCWYFLFVISE